MKLKLRENADINVVTGISDIIIDSINKKWDNIRDLNSIIVNLNEEGFEDMVPVIESILEDENKNVGKLQQLVELISPTAKSIDDGRQEAIDELDNNEIKVEEMKLDENFSNVPEETTTVVDPVFGKAVEDKEEDEKVIEDALKENEKLAKETIPEEGYTGKKVTSSALKAMHLSESLFDESWVEDTPFKIEDTGNGIYKLSQNGIINGRISIEADSKEEAKQILLDNGWKESELTEEINKPVRYSDGKTGKWWYFTTHGVQPGSIPKDLKVLDIIDTDNGTYVALDGILNTSELKQYDMKEKSPEGLEESLTESIKYDIAKELLRKFKQGRMPKDWSSSDYIKDLVSKKHLTKEEGEELLSESMNEELDTVDDFRDDIKKHLMQLKSAYYALSNREEHFDAAAETIHQVSVELKELDDAMHRV